MEMNTFAIDRQSTASHPIARHGDHINVSKTLVRIVKRILRDLKAYYRQRRQRRIDRLAFQHLIALEDDILRDIGVSRADVIWASKLPLSQNAAQELEIIARQNRR